MAAGIRKMSPSASPWHSFHRAKPTDADIRNADSTPSTTAVLDAIHQDERRERDALITQPKAARRSPLAMQVALRVASVLQAARWRRTASIRPVSSLASTSPAAIIHRTAGGESAVSLVRSISAPSGDDARRVEPPSAAERSPQSSPIVKRSAGPSGTSPSVAFLPKNVICNDDLGSSVRSLDARLPIHGGAASDRLAELVGSSRTPQRRPVARKLFE